MTIDIGFSRFSNDAVLKDWIQTPDFIGAGYESYLETFYHIMEDDMFFMQTPYVFVYLENDSLDDLTSGTTDIEKSLLVQAHWDWAEAD